MPEPVPHQITLLLEQVKAGDMAARAELTAIVYPQLKKLAADRMRRERPHHTLQATALVNEAFLRLMGSERMTLHDRNHFFAIASDLMRQILVDYARRRHAAKRGGGAAVLEFETWHGQIEDRPDLVIDIDRLLTRLSALDARQAQVVQMRYFSGLTEGEIAEALGISERTDRFHPSATQFEKRHRISGGRSRPVTLQLWELVAPPLFRGRPETPRSF